MRPRRAMPAGIKSRAEAAHVGWFGPVGVAAFFYALDVLDRLPGAEAGAAAAGEGRDALVAYLAITWVALASVGLGGSIPLYI